jgi:hypothetical protein
MYVYIVYVYLHVCNIMYVMKPTDAVCRPDIKIQVVALSNMIEETAENIAYNYAVFSGLGFNVFKV